MKDERFRGPTGDTLPPRQRLEMLPGKTLVFGPSRSGKSYYVAALKAAGLNVWDPEPDTDLIKWRDDSTGKEVSKPLQPSATWLSSHHFTIRPKELDDFLSTQGDVILFTHCWNIMDIIDRFDRVAYMSLPAGELERRLQLDRPDHPGIGSPEELDFFRRLHQERSEQARQRNIPFIDATLTPNEFYSELSRH